jgi:hypothetical protein
MKHSESIVYLTENENGLDREVLREAIRAEYHCVATSPEQGFHYHTDRSLITVVGYKEEWPAGVFQCGQGNAGSGKNNRPAWFTGRSGAGRGYERAENHCSGMVGKVCARRRSHCCNTATRGVSFQARYPVKGPGQLARVMDENEFRIIARALIHLNK